MVDTNGCWIWTGHVASNGYGQVSFGGKPASSHRVVYNLLVGAIQDGNCLDHLCRVRACVNPAHLEQVTQKENVRRGKVFNGSQCKRGHVYTEENTYMWRGNRFCKDCKKLRKSKK